MPIDSKIEFGYAETDRVKLHYARAGTGKELVVLLHGFPEFWYSWRRQLIELSADYTVVAPDLRGYNLSDRPSEVSAYKISELVEDIVGLIHHFDHKKAVVVGHDWGAGVAWAISQQHPEVLSKLVCLQVPPAGIWKRNQTLSQFLASWYMFFFQLPALPEWLLTRNNFEKPVTSLKTTTAEKDVFSDEDIEAYRGAWSKEGAITGSLNYYRANIISRMFGKSPEWRPIEVPTMFIYGEKDHAVLPQTVEGVGDAVSGPYTEIRIPEAGHWVQSEAAEKVTNALRDFIKHEE